MRESRVLFCLALALAFFAASSAAGQQATEAQATVQPSPNTQTVFVSRLKAEPVDYQVKLTWVDSPDITGVCIVYRSPEEITTQTIGRAQIIGKVNTGVGYFIDTPSDRGGYFYAVLIQDSSGTLYPIVIPFRNKTSAAVAPNTAAPEEKLAARITDIRAAVTSGGDGIEITFINSNPDRDLLLFWGTSPLSVAEDLLRSTSTAPLDPGTTRYVLAGLPGVDYWFAVLDAGMYKIGQASLEKCVNATAQPISLPLSTSRVSLSSPTASRRALPLPSLALTYGVQTGQPISSEDVPDLPSKKTVSSVTEKAISQLLQVIQPPNPTRRSPQVLESDMTPSPSGEIARLQEIIQGSFLGGDMTDTVKRLLDFLSLPRTPQLEAHARYYLGQAYYIEGKAREALMEFLVSDDFYYQENEQWIDACFENLEKEGT